MKIKNNPPRPGLATHFKDRIVIRYDPKYGQVAQSWPRRNAGGKPRGDPAKVTLWDAAIEWVKAPEPSEYAEALADTNGTAFYARDIMISAIYGNYISWPGWGWRVQLAQNIQTMLDSITDIPGSILVRREDGWHGIAPGTDAQVLTISGLGAFPNWADAPIAGITELTGDVTAGPGTGSVAGTLTNTGVIAGSYTAANLTVDAKGRVTTIANSGILSGIDQLTGDVTAGPGTGSVAGTLANTGVIAGSYTAANLTVDAKGRVTTAASGNFAAPTQLPHPGFITGQYYTRPIAVAYQNITIAAGRLYSVPIWIPVTKTFTKLAANVVAGAASSEITMGIYSSTNGLPGTLITTTNGISTTAPGVKQQTGMTITLQPGFYWLTIYSNGIPGVQCCPNTDPILTGWYGPIGWGTSIVYPQGASSLQAYVSGSMPGTFPSPALYFNTTALTFIGL